MNDEDELDDALTRFERALARFPAVQNVAQNTVRADGWVVGLSLSAFGLMLLNAIFCAIWISNLWAWKDIQARNISDLQHDVSQLKEKVK